MTCRQRGSAGVQEILQGLATLQSGLGVAPLQRQINFAGNTKFMGGGVHGFYGGLWRAAQVGLQQLLDIGKEIIAPSLQVAALGFQLAFAVPASYRLYGDACAFGHFLDADILLRAFGVV